ncbi:PepSY domain-containing protein [Puniceicoccaceae bacterium K14]|nr:PepSY domain-containing protein [Puniceicoccaceae bacterium K14]
MHKQLWKLHSWTGLICGLALLVIGLTGSILVFHQEITNTLYPQSTLNDNYSSKEDRLPLSQLTEIVENRFPDFWIRGWLFNHDPSNRDSAYVMKRGDDEWHLLYVDPYNGNVSEQPVPTNETLYGWFIDLHYTFFADHIGMGIVGIFALGFLFLSFTGIYLHRPFFKNLFRLRWGKSARIFCSDLHKAIGIGTVPVNFLLGLTGAYWNIAHLAHELIEHAGEEEHHAIEFEYSPYREQIGKLHSIAEETIPGYSLNYIYFPTKEEPIFYLYGQHEGAGVFRSLYGSHIWVPADSGEVTYSLDLRNAGLWAQIVDAFEPLHFGNFGGLLTKVLWCIAGLSPAALSISGTLIWWKRRRRKTPSALKV